VAGCASHSLGGEIGTLTLTSVSWGPLSLPLHGHSALSCSVCSLPMVVRLYGECPGDKGQLGKWGPCKARYSGTLALYIYIYIFFFF
jgi:hypothetical protein